MKRLDALLGRAAEAPVRSFGVAHDKALEKIGLFALQSSAHVLLEVVVAANLARATSLTLHRTETVLDATWTGGVSLPAREAPRLLDHLFDSELPPLRRLAVVVANLLQRKPTELTVTLVSGGEGWVLEGVDGRLRAARLTSAGDDRVAIHAVLSTPGDPADELALVRDRGRFSRVPLHLAGGPVGGQDVLTPVGETAVAFAGPDGEEGWLAWSSHRRGVVLVVGGVVVETAVVGSLTGVVRADHLRRTADAGALVHDETYDRLVRAIRRRGPTAPPRNLSTPVVEDVVVEEGVREEGVREEGVVAGSGSPKTSTPPGPPPEPPPLEPVHLDPARSVSVATGPWTVSLQHEPGAAGVVVDVGEERFQIHHYGWEGVRVRLEGPELDRMRAAALVYQEIWRILGGRDPVLLAAVLLRLVHWFPDSEGRPAPLWPLGWPGDTVRTLLDVELEPGITLGLLVGDLGTDNGRRLTSSTLLFLFQAKFGEGQHHSSEHPRTMVQFTRDDVWSTDLRYLRLDARCALYLRQGVGQEVAQDTADLDHPLLGGFGGLTRLREGRPKLEEQLRTLADGDARARIALLSLGRRVRFERYPRGHVAFDEVMDGRVEVSLRGMPPKKGTAWLTWGEVAVLGALAGRLRFVSDDGEAWSEVHDDWLVRVESPGTGWVGIRHPFDPTGGIVVLSNAGDELRQGSLPVHGVWRGSLQRPLEALGLKLAALKPVGRDRQLTAALAARAFCASSTVENPALRRMADQVDALVEPPRRFGDDETVPWTSVGPDTAWVRRDREEGLLTVVHPGHDRGMVVVVGPEAYARMSPDAEITVPVGPDPRLIGGNGVGFRPVDDDAPGLPVVLVTPDGRRRADRVDRFAPGILAIVEVEAFVPVEHVVARVDAELWRIRTLVSGTVFEVVRMAAHRVGWREGRPALEPPHWPGGAGEGARVTSVHPAYGPLVRRFGGGVFATSSDPLPLVRSAIGEVDVLSVPDDRGSILRLEPPGARDALAPLALQALGSFDLEAGPHADRLRLALLELAPGRTRFAGTSGGTVRHVDILHGRVPIALRGGVWAPDAALLTLSEARHFEGGARVRWLQDDPSSVWEHPESQRWLVRFRFRSPSAQGWLGVRTPLDPTGGVRVVEHGRERRMPAPFHGHVVGSGPTSVPQLAAFLSRQLLETDGSWTHIRRVAEWLLPHLHGAARTRMLAVSEAPSRSAWEVRVSGVRAMAGCGAMFLAAGEHGLRSAEEGASRRPMEVVVEDVVRRFVPDAVLPAVDPEWTDRRELALVGLRLLAPVSGPDQAEAQRALFELVYRM